MHDEAYERYLVNVDTQIDDGPVLGYHILMATWTMTRRYWPEPILDVGVGYRILAKQSTRRFAFMVHAGGAPIDPREDYKDFVVSICYTFESSRPNWILLREAAESFGKDVVFHLAEQRLLEPPPLERYICQYPHSNGAAEAGYSRLCSRNEKTGEFICELDGVVPSQLIERELVKLFEK